MNKNSYTNAVISIGIVCFFFGLCAFFFLHAGQLSELINEDMDIIIELEDEGVEETQDKVMTKLNSLEGILANSAEMIGKEEAFSEMEQEMGRLVGFESEENPFRNMISFNVESKYYTADHLNELENALKDIPGVLHIHRNEMVGSAIKSNVRKVAFLSLLIGLALAVFAWIIIYNTIKIALMQDSKELRIMELVGAKRMFIKRPYVNRMRKVGLKAGILAATILGLLVVFLGLSSTNAWQFIRIEFLVLSLVLSILFAVTLAWLSAQWVLSQFLNSTQYSLN